MRARLLPYENQSRASLVRHEGRSDRTIAAHVVRCRHQSTFASAAFFGPGFVLAHAPFHPVMNLNEYGAACRCLLRLRENAGAPGMSDAAFIARFLPRYPEWREQPGATDAVMIVELARELQLASRSETFRDYDRVLQEHRAGHDVLVQTERAPEQAEPPSPVRHYVMLLVEMSECDFTVWCPYPSGLSDTLPRASRVWWERWEACGLVLYPAAADVTA